ncbi:hypothetical protein [Cognatishimia activa]|nr:hypothetical protein [Cognatishimia activa]
MFKLDQTVLDALEAEARSDRSTIADILRDAIRRDLRRRTKGKSAPTYDPNVVAAMQRLLSRDFAMASGWQDLQDRIHEKGYALRASGGGLAVFDPTTQKRMAKASHFGTSAHMLARRFGEEYPEIIVPG